MHPNKSILVVASVTGALLPRRLARMLVAMVLASLVAIAGWVSLAPGQVAGLATEVLSTTANGPTLATLATPTGSRVVLLRDDPEQPVSPGDLVLASGAAGAVAGIGAFVDAGQATVLSLAPLRQWAEVLAASIPPRRVHPAALVLAALVLVLAAPLLMRGVAAAGMGLASILWAAGLWQMNLVYLVAPLPATSLDSVLLGAGLVGAVAAWKASSGDRLRLAERVGAALSLLVAWFLVSGMTGRAPSLGLVLMVAPFALLLPTLVPVAAAVALLGIGFDLAPEALVALGLGLAILRLWRDGRRARAAISIVRPGTGALPQPDARGAFDLTRMFRTGQES